MISPRIVLVAASAMIWTACLVQADVFNMSVGQKSLEFVTIGDEGNAGEQSRLALGDTAYYGAVGYQYRMAKYDVTMAQYCQFLNAVAKTDAHHLYNEYMGTDDFYDTAHITRSGISGSYQYEVTGSYGEAANCPIPFISWGSAARFCNWLQTARSRETKGRARPKPEPIR